MLVISDNEEYYGNLENLEKKMSQVLEKKKPKSIIKFRRNKRLYRKRGLIIICCLAQHAKADY